MRRSCVQRDCYVSEDGICQMGEPNAEVCEFRDEAVEAGPEPEALPAVQWDRLHPPWTGRALSGSDVAPLVGHARPFLIGLLGSSDAGKTTYLMTSYLRLHQGRSVEAYRFAASYTLGGWENLADYGRFGPGQPPRFPPHTSSGLERTPGLLHLAFRHEKSGTHDMAAQKATTVEVLLADAPGEWFDQWAVASDASASEGARWIIRHADGIMLFLDCDALAGSQRGGAVTKLVRLLDRLGPKVMERPVAAIWSKTDRYPDIPAAIRVRIETALVLRLPNRKEFFVRAGNPDPDPQSGVPEGGVAASMAWLLDEIKLQTMRMEASPPFKSPDPFFAYRGRSAEGAG